ncbi:MAG: poly(R)-hydroxyalkanoic acid synthase subunit PhaE [Steroidobacteraceae bacterium]
MPDDLWRQWQAFAALWAPAAPGTQASSASDGSFGFAPFIDAAERFKAAAQTFLDGAASGSASAAAAAAQNLSDFLRDEFADARLPWNAGFGPGVGARAQRSSISDWPALGPMREHQQRWQRMTEAGRRIDDAQRRLQRLWSDALRQAAADFAARLQPPLSSAADAEALRKLYDTWIDCAEDAYARTAHSEAFCNAQAELVNAGSQWRQELQAGIEHWAKLLDLPTRSEINTLAQRLKSIEEQLRAAVPAARAAAPRAKPRVARRKSSPARHKGVRRKAKR